MRIINSVIRTYLTILLLTSLLSSQPLHVEKLTISEGLSNSRVHGVMQDSYGLLWIATNDGLNLYDGYTFKIFKNVPGNPNSIQSNIIWEFTEDLDRNIWIATETGVSKYLRDKNIFVNYDLSEQFPGTSGSNARALSVMIDSSNTVWAGTVGLGAIKFDKTNDKWQLTELAMDDSSKNKQGQSALISITMDHHGKIWAGTFNEGLICYDREKQEFRQAEIKNQNESPDFSLNDNNITKLYFDPTDILWITTRTGIYKYNPRTKLVETLKKYTTNVTSFWNYFNDIVQDSKGNIWIANNQRGILKFDGISNDSKLITIEGQNFNREGISDIIITWFCVDRTGIMWFGTVTDGLLKYDPQLAPFRHYYYSEKNKNSISSNQVFGICESKVHKGKIYVGTRGGGLNLFDPEKDTFEKIEFKVINDQFGGSVRAILEEYDGTLWLGTWGDGLLKMDKNYNVLQRFVNDSARVNSLPDNSVRNITKGPNGKLWVGANEGLAVLDENTNQIRRINERGNAVYPQGLYDLINKKTSSKNSLQEINKVGNDANLTSEFKVIKPRYYLVFSTGESVPPDSVMYDYGWIEDLQGKEIWTSVHALETYFLGGNLKNRIKIDLIELKPGQYKLRYKSDDSHGYGSWNSDQPTYTDFWGIGLCELDDQNDINTVQTYLNETRQQKYIQGRNIRSVHFSKNNILWIGSDTKGLNKYDLLNNAIKTYANEPDNPNSLSDNSVQYIYEDKDGILWLATNNGLNRFDPVKEEFNIYTEADGLPTNYIASILPGDDSELWLATRNGLSRMVTDKLTGKITFVNYDASDGLGGTDFIALVALKSSTGRYYFGGEHGLNTFVPGDANMSPPSLIFSDLKISNESVLTMKDDSPLESSLFDLEHLDLPYNRNDLSFDFSALHYSNPQKNQYAHMLKGYDKDWIYDNKRSATYTNLDPGHYVFSFKGTNRDGVWNDKARSLEITIHPPWWRTLWAYIAYGLILIAVVFSVDRLQRRRLLSKARERMRLKEAEMRAETAELQAKAAEAESRALEAENARKSLELEEARELQLSMLPKELPQLPNLDIAVYMKTATEVGGDYYDFHVGMDGTLTVVIGDATGHGMKAGTMVTTAKSLFNSYAPNPDILFSFQEITRCIKQMNLGKMSMCMTMLKVKGNKLFMSSAGMPPSFIFRRDTRIVEEHLMQGMPLGTMDNFQYKIQDTTLNPGDTILLLTDGLPELQNAKGQIYGYKRVRNLFEEAAEKAPEDIINQLKNDGSAWVNEKDPEDDVTFVVIKVK